MGVKLHPAAGHLIKKKYFTTVNTALLVHSSRGDICFLRHKVKAFEIDYISDSRQIAIKNKMVKIYSLFPSKIV